MLQEIFNLVLNYGLIDLLPKLSFKGVSNIGINTGNNGKNTNYYSEFF